MDYIKLGICFGLFGVVYIARGIGGWRNETVESSVRKRIV